MGPFFNGFSTVLRGILTFRRASVPRGEVCHPPPNEKSRRGSETPAARKESDWQASALDGVGTLPVFALRGSYGQPHLLANRPGQEPAYRMRLPAGCLHQLLRGCAAGPS